MTVAHPHIKCHDLHADAPHKVDYTALTISVRAPCMRSERTATVCILLPSSTYMLHLAAGSLYIYNQKDPHRRRRNVMFSGHKTLQRACQSLVCCSSVLDLAVHGSSQEHERCCGCSRGGIRRANSRPYLQHQRLPELLHLKGSLHETL